MIDTTKAPASGHYKGLAIEPIELIKALKLDFATGSFVKYLCRYTHKGDPVTDLRKAKFYLSLIERAEYSLSDLPTSMRMVEFYCAANRMSDLETKCLASALDGFTEAAEQILDGLISKYDEPAR